MENQRKSGKICRGGVKKDREILREKEWYREKIVEIIENTENEDYLEFIYNMMISFKEKWGI